MTSTPGAERGRNQRSEQSEPKTFGRTLVRVMTVQVISLLALWLLQATFAR